MNRNFKIVALAALASSMLCGAAYAATQSVTANASFDAVLALTKNSDINFGTLKAGVVGATYVIDTAGTVTPSNGGVVIGGSHNAADISIVGSTTQTVAISTGTYVADSGVTPSLATCKYNGVAIANCDTGGTGLTAPTGTAKHLLVGVQIDADGSQTAGTTAAPTFVVTVVYG